MRASFCALTEMAIEIENRIRENKGVAVRRVCCRERVIG